MFSGRLDPRNSHRLSLSGRAHATGMALWTVAWLAGCRDGRSPSGGAPVVQAATRQADLCSVDPRSVEDLEGIWEDRLDEWSLVRLEVDRHGSAKVTSLTCTHFLESQHRLVLDQGRVHLEPPAVVWPEEEWREVRITCEDGRPVLSRKSGTKGGYAEIELGRRFSKGDLWNRASTLPVPGGREAAAKEWASWDLDEADLRAARLALEHEDSPEVRKVLAWSATRSIRDDTEERIFAEGLRLLVSGTADREPEIRWQSCLLLIGAARPPCDAPATPRNVRARTILEGVATSDVEPRIRCLVGGVLENGQVPEDCPPRSET